MTGKPQAPTVEQQLKDHIKKVWAQWVKSQITRPQLLDSVATFVCSTCEEAKNIDVIHEFKVWYEREFELQRQRNNNDAGRRGTAPSQQAPGSVLPASLTGVDPQHGNLHASRGQQLPAGLAQLSSVLPFPSGQKASGKPPAIMPVKMKQEPVVTPPKAKLEPTVSPLGAPGKPAVNKSTPGRPAGRSAGKQAGKGFAGKQGGTGAGRSAGGKNTGRKSVGGKSLSRPPMMTKAEPAVVSNVAAGVAQIPPGPVVLSRDGGNDAPSGGVGISSFAGVSPGGGVPGMSAIPPHVAGVPGTPSGRPSVAGKAVPAGKGLLGNKAPAAPKGKGARKGSVKSAAAKSVSKGSPGSSKAKTPGSPSVESGAGSSSVGGPAVGDKRGLDVVATSSPAQTGKKPKGGAKAPRPPPPKKKTGAASSPVSGFPKNVKPPPARPDHLKNRPGSKPAPGALIQPSPSGGSAGMSTVSPVAPSAKLPPAAVPSAVGVAAGGGAVKRNKREDEVLNVVNGVVDIEAEEDRLAMPVETNEVVLVDENIYSESMLLAGAKLRAKMQAMAKRFMLDENVGSDVMEMMSLAVEERLRYVLEKLKEAAAVRTEMRKVDWLVEDEGQNIFDKLQQMQEDEERALTVAAEMRVKKRNERKEAEAKKANGESTTTEKKKESNTNGDAERKEKLALEKKRKETRSQHDALSGLVEERTKRGKRPLSGKLAGLAPIGGSSGLPPIGGVGALPPIGRKPGSQSFGSNSGSKNKTLDRIEKLSKLGPLKKLGRAAALEEQKAAEAAEVVKEPLKLNDCIFLMENDVAMRKSTLYYKWAARLGMS